jgi:hypothetical protein
MKTNLAVDVDVVEVPCRQCGVGIEEGLYCEPCREVIEAMRQLDERFARQEGL